jgi:hypothetical protein
MLDYRDCFLGVPIALAGVFACLCDVHKLLPFFVSSGSGYCLCECTTKMMLTVYFYTLGVVCKLSFLPQIRFSLQINLSKP